MAANDPNTPGTVEAPHIQAVDPGQGQVGQDITVTGTDFFAVKRVSFSGVEAPHFTPSEDGKTLTVTVPVNAKSGPLVVTTDVGSSPGFHFSIGDTMAPPPVEPPEINKMTPASGPTGQEVVLKGHYLVAVNRISIGDVPVTQFTATDGLALKLTIPANAQSGPIEVTTGAGTATSPPFKVTKKVVPGGTTPVEPSTTTTPVEPPVIDRMSPESGPVGRTVVLTGHYLVAVERITIGEVPVTEFSAAKDGLTLTLTIPTTGQSGPINVKTRMGTASSPEFEIREEDLPEQFMFLDPECHDIRVREINQRTKRCNRCLGLNECRKHPLFWLFPDEEKDWQHHTATYQRIRVRERYDVPAEAEALV